MNLILLFCEDFITPFDSTSDTTGQVRLSDRRLHHIQRVHKAKIGDTLSVGLLNGNIGEGLLLSLEDDHCVLDITLQLSPPPPLPLTLILALPRPKMLKRTLQTCATMGVKTIILVNSYRVEKSFWQSPLLDQNAIKEQLLLGLEQAKDTVLPEVFLEKRFKPFVEDTLPALSETATKLVAHPNKQFQAPIKANIHQQTFLAVGPEGGFIQYEVDKLLEIGFSGISLGPRILRVETAIPVLLAHLF